MAVTERTKASRSLDSAERKLAKVVASENAFIAKAQAKAATKYTKKIQEAQAAVLAARNVLSNLVNGNAAA